MTKKLNLLAVSLFITVLLFVYLTVHHFALKLGLSGSALCSISSKVNCDAAALSSYSEIFGIPIAILGGMFHFLLLGYVLFIKFDWIESNIDLQKTIRAMLISSAAVSLLMGLISTIVIQVFCPFCIGTYLFSFLNLYLGWNLVLVDHKQKWNLTHFLNASKSHLVFLLLVPVSSWIVSGMIYENYGLNELKKVVPEKIAQWKASPVYDFNPDIGLKNGSATNKIVIVEFADFKCPHCKAASKTLDTYLKTRSDIQFIFKPFPLDGNCNSSDQITKGDGTRCTMAAWVMCSEKIAQKGWLMHHWLFENQEEFSAITDLKSLLPQIEKEFQIKADQLTACADSSETYDLIKKSSEEGNKAQVSGTPTIYLNGQKLTYGHVLEVLKTAVNELN